MNRENFTVECAMNATANLSHEGILSSGDYGPCTIICTYDPVHKRGEMFHYVMPTTNMVESFLDKVVDQSSSKNNIQAYLRGGGLSIVPIEYQATSDAEIIHNRNSIAQIVRGYFSEPPQLDVKWSGRDTNGISLLDVANGNFISEEQLPTEYRFDLGDGHDYDCYASRFTDY